MTSMGFEYSRNTYTLTLTKLGGNKDKITVEIDVKEKDNNEYEVVAALLTDNYSWIDLSGKSYKDVMDNITSIMRAITLTTLANSFEIFNKTKDANMDLVNEMVMSNMTDMMDVEKKSFKEYLINTLEETLNNLKK
jgi:hypothetical protein